MAKTYRQDGKVNKDKMSMESFGKKVLEERLRRNWTQKQLAEMAGIAQAHLSKIEGGTRRAGRLLQEKIEYVLFAKGAAMRAERELLANDMANVSYCSPVETAN